MLHTGFLLLAYYCIMKKTIYYLTALCFMLVPVSCSGQVKTEAKIQWVSFEQAVEKSEKAPKKIFIDVYTHWCGWCKKMDKSTFMNDTVADYINQNYYAVKLDAEQKDSIVFRDKVFTFKPEYKSHELAVALLNGKMSYPTYVFLDENFNMLTPLSGYQTTEQLIPALKYFSDNIYKTMKWEDYVKELNSPPVK